MLLFADQSGISAGSKVLLRPKGSEERKLLPLPPGGRGKKKRKAH